MTIFVKSKHFRACGYCAPGVRSWLRKNNLDGHKFFLHGGLPIEQIRGTGDAMAAKVADAAEREAKEGNK